jgi:hypothetical protein
MTKLGQDVIEMYKPFENHDADWSKVIIFNK